jgi:hypothetical protein
MLGEGRGESGVLGFGLILVCHWEVCVCWDPCLCWYDTGRCVLDGIRVYVGMTLAGVCLLGSVFMSV